MIGTTTRMTEPARRTLSARARIIGAMVVLVAIAFASALVLSAQFLSARTDALVDDRLTHAATSFRTFAESPSGRSHFSVDELLTRYLQDTVANRAETAFSLLDDAPHRRMGGDPPVRLDKDAAFLASIADQSEPVHGSYKTASGTIVYALIPVQVAGDPTRGALVSIQFRNEVAAPLYSSLGIFALAGALAVMGAGIASWVIAGRVLAPVRQVRETAESISETDLRGRIDVVGRDDVAALATTFNRMLDRLETAFATQKQFVDDAGHELRTPITVIRGQLELISDDPADRRETIALVTDELDRMGRMVNDLLVLAKSEQPDFVVFAEVDLADLVVDALSKVSMLGAQHWVLDELAEGRIKADGQRLTQALMQLASNAVSYTPVDGTIALGSRLVLGGSHGDRLFLWVRDTGTGMDKEAQQGIFARFHRGSSPRQASGAGLGLAIVQSIAHAHGGSVAVESAPGTGTTFTMELPAEIIPDDHHPLPADSNSVNPWKDT